MISPSEQWAIQIDVTNACDRACSNCTRLVGHGPTFFMGVKQFAAAVDAVCDFPSDGPRCLVGLIGGEPLLHPQFSVLLDILESRVQRDCRGLWTGFDYQASQYGDRIKEVFAPGGIHNNRHDLTPSRHSPILVASADVVPDEVERREIIDACWLQHSWSSTITPKGYFFCEVAGAIDRVFGGPGGLPVKPGCWKRPLADFSGQMKLCERCGIALNLAGRMDADEVDDVSATNLSLLESSRRIQRGQFIEFVPGSIDTADAPWEYTGGES